MFPRDAPPNLEGFEILERLGAGGAGEVYLAKSRAGRHVAIKVLAEAVTNEDEIYDAFVREAKLCSRLRHPAIVQLRAFVDVGPAASVAEQGEGGRVSALVFEYVPGVALSRLLKIAAQKNQRIPDNAAWHVLESVLSALACAHEQKDNGEPSPIVHRDVSPSNVLLDWSGAVKLTDFGMGKILGAAETTRVGMVKGTAGCMAPEQARGEPVTERADVYAAALLGWRLATGRAPFARFEDDELEMLRAMRNPKLDPLSAMRPDLPPALHAAFGAALEPNPELRTITAGELRDVVRAQCDVAAGAKELEALLSSWRPTLERTAAPGVSSDAKKRSGPTAKYDQVAAKIEGEEVPKDPRQIDIADGEFEEEVPTEAYVRKAPRPSLASLPPASLPSAPPTGPSPYEGMEAPTPIAPPAELERAIAASVEPTPPPAPTVAAALAAPPHDTVRIRRPKKSSFGLVLFVVVAFVMAAVVTATLLR